MRLVLRTITPGFRAPTPMWQSSQACSELVATGHVERNMWGWLENQGSDCFIYQYIGKRDLLVPIGLIIEKYR